MQKKRTYFLLIGIAVLLFIGIVLFRYQRTNNSTILSTIKKTVPFIPSNTSPEGVKNAAVDHIVIITMENKLYSDIVDNEDAPYINSLIHNYSFTDNYFAVSHPSLPNYIALLSGSTQGITSDCTDCYLHAPNLVDQLEQSQKTWKGYMESMPSPCFVGSDGKYAQKHNPFMYFDDIRNDPNRCNNVVPFTQLSTDLQSEATTPNFIWISPNLCNDMHDCDVATGDQWLSQQVPLILASPAFKQQKSLLFITWDEGEGSDSNQVPMIAVADWVQSGFVSHIQYSHYSLLHTLEALWQLPPLNQKTEQSAIMTDIVPNLIQ